MKNKKVLFVVLGVVLLLVIVVAGVINARKGGGTIVQVAEVKRQDITARVRSGPGSAAVRLLI
jgi:hypothetical protein